MLTQQTHQAINLTCIHHHYMNLQPKGHFHHSLPCIVDPVFSWGEHKATQFIALLNTTYAEAIYWKIPYGAIGKSFMSELARLFKAFAESSALESVALRAATIMPILLLQKLAKKSKAKDHTKCLQRRLNTWREGDLNKLLREGQTIQQHIPRNTPPMTEDKLSRLFANHRFQGKTKAALRLLSEQNRGGVLHLDDPIDTENGTRKVCDILIDKHPPSQPANRDSIINADPPDLHPFFLSAWTPQSSSQPPYTLVEQPAHPVLMHSVGEDYVPPLRQPPKSYVTLLP